MRRGRDKQRVSWAEPYWHHIPRYRGSTEQVAGVFGHKFILRPLLISACFLVLAIGYMQWRYPGAWIPYRPLLFALLGLPLSMQLSFFLHLLIPRGIAVGPKGISVSHGQSGYAIKAEQIRSMHLDASNPLPAHAHRAVHRA